MCNVRSYVGGTPDAGTANATSVAGRQPWLERSPSSAPVNNQTELPDVSSFAAGIIATVRGYVVRGSEIWLYVFGTPCRHQQHVRGTGEIRRYVLRRDGWAALVTDASSWGQEAATVVTKAFQLPQTARSLHINALANDGGSIEVTLWAERSSNFTIVGKAVPIFSNSVDHTLMWEHGNGVVERASQMGKLQLRLALRNAKIFSYWFEEDSNPSPSPSPNSCKGAQAQCVAKGKLNDSKMCFHPKDAKFIDSWRSDCCPGLMCRLGSKVGDWRCSNSIVRPAGPLEVVVRGPKKLPAKLPTNRTVLGLQSYESSIARFSSGELVLAYFADRDSTCEQRRGNGCGLALRRSLDSGESFGPPEYHPDLGESWLTAAILWRIPTAAVS